jgi:predicted transcriptional regulator of viral defense system
MQVSPQKAVEAERIFREHNGLLRREQAERLGIHKRVLYHLYDAGIIERVSRGLYRLSNLDPMAEHDLVTVISRIPKGIICLISALAYHGTTTQIPHEVHLALPPGAWQPTLDYPPIRVFRFSGASLTEGIEKHIIDGVGIRLYNPAKTVADCFKFRNKIGLDVAIEALRFTLERHKASPASILHYARICRVERVVMPYLEALS